MTKRAISTASPLPVDNKGQISSFSAPPAFLFFVMLMLFASIAAYWQKVDSPAFLFHLKIGQVLRNTGQVPNRDIFSAGSSVERWAYIEWVWSGILAMTFELGKWKALNILTVLLGAIVAALTVLRCRMHGSRLFESVSITALVCAALIPVYSAEPAYAALALFALSLLVSESRRLWPMIFLVPIVACWANVQAAFLLPLLVPVARLLFPPPSQQNSFSNGPHVYLAVIILGGICGAMITPHSVEIAVALLKHVTIDSAIASPHAAAILLAPDVLIRVGMAFILLAIMAIGRHPVYLWEITVFAVLAGFTLVSPDALNFLLIYLAAPAARSLSRITGKLWGNRKLRPMGGIAFSMLNLAAIVVVLFVGRITPAAFGSGLHPTTFPEMAAGRLSALPLRAAILNPAGHGGYLAWRLWPGWKITIDERPTLYTPEFRDQYDKLWEGGKGWQAMFNLWRISAVLGNNEIIEKFPNHNLYYELADSSEWTPVFWDQLSIVYVKSNINLISTNLSAFRILKPGLSWPAMESRIKSDAEWNQLAADLRRALLDDPGNVIAREFLARIEQKISK